MKYIFLDHMKEQELYPGFLARIIHTDLQSISYVRCLEGAVLPPHKHTEEQVLNLISGDMEVTVEGETRRCAPGSVIHIPSNAIHTVTAITECLAIDIFSPVRDKYLSMGIRTDKL